MIYGFCKDYENLQSTKNKFSENEYQYRYDIIFYARQTKIH